MEYRREIDGLRAVALLPVILFHAGFEIFSGGFVGVDVFFVISGYLITGIILRENERGAFSLINFYERRVRRILPALFFVMACCIPFAWMWMLPSHMRSFSEGVMAVSLFGSNFLFWRKSGYFSPSGDENPLLHTWSLGVEEQFYLVFPLFVMLAWRFGRNRLAVLIGLSAIAGLVLCEFGWRYAPTANFYLPFTRHWELLLGSLCALAEQRSLRRPSGVAVFAGLALIVFSIFVFDENTPFPSIYTLAPVLGTALIIMFADSASPTTRLLASKPLVGIGLISYSAYLWHQPLFAFARIRSIFPPSDWLMLTLAFASLALAYISWRFVELPFRTKGPGALVTRPALFRSAALLTCGFIGFGLYGYLTGGFETREFAGRSSVAIEDKVRINHGLNKVCEKRFTLSPACRTDDEPTLLVWGDSFAMHLVDGILADDADIALIQHTKSRCPPFLGISPQAESTFAPECMAFNDAVFNWLRQTPSVKHVVLSSPFANILDDDRKVQTRNGVALPADVETAVRYFSESLDAIEALGRTVVVVSPPPFSGQDIGNCLKKSLIYNRPLSACNFKDIRVSAESGSMVNEFLSEIDRNYAVVWLNEFICSEGECFAAERDTFIYRDKGHLAKEGSALLGMKYGFARLFTETH